MITLAVTCDDCGLSEGINLAAARLYEDHLITATTIMTNFSAAQHAFELFSRYPALDLGVHLNLTDGFSVTRFNRRNDLTDAGGHFGSRRQFFTHALLGRRSFLALVEEELTAQIDVFLHGGIKPRHLTTHLQFHALPVLRAIVYQLAERFNVRWVRASDLRRAVIPLNLLLPSSGSAPTTAPIIAPDYLVGLQAWMQYSSPTKLCDTLLRLNGKIELVVHPCLETDPTFPSEVRYPPRQRFIELAYYRALHQRLFAQGVDKLQLSAV